MEFILALLLVAYAMYRALRMPRGKKWFIALLAVFVIGLGLAFWETHEIGQKNCGDLYVQDIGCAKRVPDWVVPAGIVLGFVEVGLSLVVLIVAEKRISAAKKKNL